MFFLNILVVNKEQVIANKINEKVPEGLFGLLRKGANAVAAQQMTDDKFSAQIAAKLGEKVPAAVAEMGISLDFQPRFQRGSYVVIRVEVKEVGTEKLLRATKGEEYAKKFMEMLALFDYFQLEDAKKTVRQKIDEKVEEGLMEKLCVILPEKLKAENVIVEVNAKSQKDQAEFFFSFLETIDNNKK